MGRLLLYSGLLYLVCLFLSLFSVSLSKALALQYGGFNLTVGSSNGDHSLITLILAYISYFARIIIFAVGACLVYITTKSKAKLRAIHIILILLFVITPFAMLPIQYTLQSAHEKITYELDQQHKSANRQAMLCKNINGENTWEEKATGEFYKFTCKEGKYDGTFVIYKNGNIHSETEYRNGYRDGINKNYNEDGTLLSQILYTPKHEKLYSFIDVAEEDEKLIYSQPYDEQEISREIASQHEECKIRDGLNVKYYQNSKLSTPFMSFVCKDGRFDGILKEFFPNGTLRSETSYKYGVKSGPITIYHENSKLSLTGNYKDNQRSGIFRDYDENGKLIREMQY